MSERNLKEVIVALLRENHLLSAGAIREKLLTQGKHFNKTSVYRSLEQLEIENIICRHHFEADEAVFELADHEHVHLVCRYCGKISTAPEQAPVINNSPDFTVEHQHITLLGKCKDCTKIDL